MNLADMDIETYIEEGLIAVQPVYRFGQGKFSYTDIIVYTLKNSYILDCKMRTVENRLYNFFNVDRSRRNKELKKRLGVKRNFPLAISEHLIFIRLKTRNIINRGDESNSLVNLSFIMDVEGSDIIFKTGESFSTLLQEETLINQIYLAQNVRCLLEERSAWLKAMNSPDLDSWKRG